MHRLSSWMVVITSGLPQAIGEGMKLNSGTNIMRPSPIFFVGMHMCGAGLNFFLNVNIAMV